MSALRFTTAMALTCAAGLFATGCGNSADPPGGTAPADFGVGDTPAVVTVNDIADDLQPRLAEEFGDANLTCGLTDPFSGGFVGGPLREGNAMACGYMSDMTAGPDTDIIWAEVLVTMLTDDSYVYSAAQMVSFDEKQAGATEAAPEFLYRDGLTCEQLTAPPAADTVPGPDFAGAADDPTAGGDTLTYAQVMYYWIDTGRPSELDPAGQGRPCSDAFDAAEVDEFFANPITVRGTGTAVDWADPPATAYQVRSTLAERDDMPSRATQVDCTLAGPITQGNAFTCAPRMNSAADSRAVAIVNSDGGFIVGPSTTEMRERQATSPVVTPGFYSTGLTCEQVRAPVTAETFNTAAGIPFEQAIASTPGLDAVGLDYFNAILYAFTTTDPSGIEFDDEGWPCASTYPSDEVAEVKGSVQPVSGQ